MLQRLRKKPTTILWCIAGATLALAGCGGGSGSSSATTQSSFASTAESSGQTGQQSTPQSTTSTATQSTTSKVPTINIPVHVGRGSKTLSAKYTCDGEDISPPISWGKVPSDTKEIAIFIFNGVEVNEKLVSAWAVAGLKPSVRSLQPGHLPAGTVLGRNSQGQGRYSICPPKGKSTLYVVIVAPVPRTLSPQAGFEPSARQPRR